MMTEWKTRYAENGRITLNKEIARLMMINEGDYVRFYIDDGRIYIKKETELYNGFDIESEEIESRIRKFDEVNRMMEGNEVESQEPEYEDERTYLEEKQIAHEMYERSKKK